MATLHVRSDVRDLSRSQSPQTRARNDAANRPTRAESREARAARRGPIAAAASTPPSAPNRATAPTKPTPRVLAACRRMNAGFYDQPEVIDAVVDRVLKALSRE